MKNFFEYLKRLRYAILTLLLVIIASTILAFYNLERFEEFATFNLQHEGILLSHALESSIATRNDLEDIKSLQARIDRFVAASENNIELNIMVLKDGKSEIIASNDPGNLEETSDEEHKNLLVSLKRGKPVVFIDVEDEDDDDDDDEDKTVRNINQKTLLVDLQVGERFLSVTTPLIFDGKGLGSINAKLSLESIDQKIGSIRLSIQVAAIIEIIMVLAGFAILVKLFMEEKLNLLAEESMRYQAELKALQSQVNPHFLFNTLNSLTSLISVNPERAEDLTIEMSELFRKILGASKKGWWTIGDELDLIRNYLNLESARLGEKLQFSISLSHRLESSQIPCLVIEPLVENAIRHGINTSVMGGEIKIEINGQTDLMVTVEDILTINDSFPRSQATKNEQVGIKNVAKRLNLIYGNAASFALETSENGAISTIKIDNFRKSKNGKV